MSRTKKKSIDKFNSRRGVFAPHRILKDIEDPQGIQEHRTWWRPSNIRGVPKPDEREYCTDRMHKQKRALTKAIRAGLKKTTRNIIEREL